MKIENDTNNNILSFISDLQINSLRNWKNQQKLMMKENTN